MQLRSEINITPLVDVVLVLLIIFMVVSPLTYQGYDVKIPSKWTVSSPQKSMLIEQNERDIVVLNRTSIPVNELSDRLREIFIDHERSVIYSGSDDLYYGEVAQTLDAIRDAGTEKIGITTYDQK
jgi:biopolymer transport protein ExbD